MTAIRNICRRGSLATSLLLAAGSSDASSYHRAPRKVERAVESAL